MTSEVLDGRLLSCMIRSDTKNVVSGELKTAVTVMMRLAAAP